MLWHLNIKRVVIERYTYDVCNSRKLGMTEYVADSFFMAALSLKGMGGQQQVCGMRQSSNKFGQRHATSYEVSRHKLQDLIYNNDGKR